MKKFLFFTLSCLILLSSTAQVPHQVNYQGIARNSVGNVLPNQPITVRLSVRDGSAGGTVVYSETRNVTTNAFGLFFYGIGSAGATSVTGTLAGVNWAIGNKYLQVEIDPKGGTSFTDAGTTQLLSVPYALYAAGASPTGNAGGSLTGIYPNPTIANGAITLGMIAPGVLPTTLPPTGPAGGSLTGTYPNPLISNGAVSQVMIAPGVTLPPNGPAGGSLTGTYPNPTIANGVVSQAMIAPGVTLPPNGPAGGSLTGTYPNPLIANGAVTQGMIAPGVTLTPSGTASGDLSGSYPNPTVSRIQGRSVNNTTPVLNDVLSFNGSSWGPVSLSSITSNVWTLNGTNIFNNNTGNVGIGTNTPAYKLHVQGGHGFFTDSVIAKNIRVGSSSTTTGLLTNADTYGLEAYANFVAVFGKSTGGVGVFGEGFSYGVYGVSTDYIGVLGGSTYGDGVFGSGKRGVKATGSEFGVHSSGGHTGVYGTGSTYGVLGVSDDIGVNGTSNTNIGVRGLSYSGSAVFGSSTEGMGVNGYCVNGRAGNFHSVNGYGLWAKTSRADASWAGVFEGNVYTYNAYQSSDKNLKKDINDVNDAMNILLQLKPKIYEFRSDGKFSNLNLPKGRHYGVLAQDLEEVLPNLVKEVENEVSPPPVLDTQNGEVKLASSATVEKIKTKAVNYTELIPIMIKGIQEQQQTIEDQKIKISTLEARLARLESILLTGSKK